MFEEQIRILGRQGLTSGTIASRLGLNPDHVRQVLNTACTAETKPIYDGVIQAWHKQQAAAHRKKMRHRKLAAQTKKARALAAIAAAQAELDQLG